MKKSLIFISMMVLAGQTLAAVKPCEELKGEIEAALNGKGVAGYTLSVVLLDANVEGTQVGTCNGNASKIMYTKGSGADVPVPVSTPAAARAPATESTPEAVPAQ
jgi:hypothetical protein